jgi:hypothetical protein
MAVLKFLESNTCGGYITKMSVFCNLELDSYQSAKTKLGCFVAGWDTKDKRIQIYPRFGTFIWRCLWREKFGSFDPGF